MSKHRQELKSNELATWLEHRIQAVLPYVKPLLVVAAVMLVVVLTVYVMNVRRSTQSSVGWRAFINAGNEPAALLDVAEKHPGTDAGLWARARRASRELREAARRMYSDRDEAGEAVEAAKADFEIVRDQTAGQADSLLHVQALFGLGEAHELMFEAEEAKKYYQQLIDAAPESALADMARRRIETLDDGDIQQFYAWFENQQPPRPGMTPPSGTVPDVMDLPDSPGDLGDLPDFPDLSVPTPSSTPRGPPAPPETATPDEPATPSTPPAQEPSTGDTPPAEGPAEGAGDATPADPKPPVEGGEQPGQGIDAPPG